MALANCRASRLATIAWEGRAELSLDRRDGGNCTGGRVGVGSWSVGSKVGVFAATALRQFLGKAMADLTEEDALKVFVADSGRRPSAPTAWPPGSTIACRTTITRRGGRGSRSLAARRIRQGRDPLAAIHATPSCVAFLSGGAAELAALPSRVHGVLYSKSKHNFPYSTLRWPFEESVAPYGDQKHSGIENNEEQSREARDFNVNSRAGGHDCQH
jgi:hypothetical protein